MNPGRDNEKVGEEGIVRLMAVGDICPGDFSIAGLGVRTMTKRYGCDFPFEKLGGFMDGVDLAIGNLEGCLSYRCVNEDLRVCGLPGMAQAVRRAGFDIVSVANNHVLDYGPEILEETIFHCREAGLQICGLRGNGAYYCEPVVLERNSVKCGFLAYNWVGLENRAEMGKYIATVEDGVVNYTWERNGERDKRAQALVKERNGCVLEDIKRLKKEVDVVILLPHWGYEWTIYPPFGVVLEAHTFIEAGANLILGSHPHVPQGFETVGNKLIAYSLGNFLFDDLLGEVSNGMVLDCTIKSGEIRGYRYFFIANNKHFQPSPASEEQQAEDRALIDRSSRAVISDEAEKRLADDLIYREYEEHYSLRKRKKVQKLFVNLLKNPFLIRPILSKAGNLVQIILLRIKGQKVRW